MRLLLLVTALAASPAFQSVAALADPVATEAARAVVCFHGGTGFVANDGGLVVTAGHVAQVVGPEPWV